MTKNDDILLKLIEHSDKQQALKHVILFARNEARGREKRSLEYYVDLILQITSK